MPFYVGDYLRDTGRLTTEAHGAYMLLIFDYWTSGAPLPDDDAQLATIARLRLAAWKKLRPIIAAFFTVADGLWRHKRIDAELETAANVSAAKSRAGKMAVQERERKRFARVIDNTRTLGVSLGITTPTDDLMVSPNDHQTMVQTISQPQSPKDLSKKVDELIQTIGGKRRFPGGKADYDDPAVRKASWQQKIETEIRSRLPEANARAIIAGYVAGDPEAVEFYETVDRSIKDRRQLA